MLLAHKIELKINNKQKTYLSKACGVARKAYNWALAEWEKQYKAGGKPSEVALRRELNAIKKNEFPWMLEVTKNAPQMAIIQLGQAFKNFFAKRANYPKFRKKWRDDRFTLSNDQFAVNDSRIRIPRLGWIRMSENLRFVGKITSATISRIADKWFVSITVDIPDQKPTANENQVAIGIDLGVSDFATLSNGKIIQGPKPYKRLLDKIKRLSKSLSRKKKGSNNRNKAKLKLAKLHYRISCIRKECIHQLTTYLIKHFAHIGIEDLNVKGMMKNRRLSRAISDMGFYEFRRQLDYKTKIWNRNLVVADRWFASTKICSNSNCSYVNRDLKLSDREWICPKCLVKHRRDLNSAINLEQVAVSSAVVAFGASSSGAVELSTASYGALN